jgi:hypothetical protein
MKENYRLLQYAVSMLNKCSGQNWLEWKCGNLIHNFLGTTDAKALNKNEQLCSRGDHQLRKSWVANQSPKSRLMYLAEEPTQML